MNQQSPLDTTTRHRPPQDMSIKTNAIVQTRDALGSVPCFRPVHPLDLKYQPPIVTVGFEPV